MRTTPTEIDNGVLVKEDRVHGSAFREPEIFADELAKIFYLGWIYVGHASEISRPGDFRVTTNDQQSVIMVRNDARQVQMHTSGCLWGHKRNAERAARWLQASNPHSRPAM